MVPVNYDANHGVAYYYRSDRAKADLKHAKLKHQYFVPSAIILCAMILVLRVITTLIALAHGALLLAEIMWVFLWIEPLIVFLIWLQWYAGVWGAFLLALLSFLAKGAYLTMYFLYYWGDIEPLWFWITASLLIAFCIVSFMLIGTTVNVLLGKMHHCNTFNDLDRLTKAVERNFGPRQEEEEPPLQSQPSPQPRPRQQPPASSMTFTLDIPLTPTPAAESRKTD